MKNEKKEFSIKSFCINYIVIELIALSAVLFITDKIYEITDITLYVTRLIPIFLSTIFLSFLVIKSNAKHAHKKDAENFKKALIILPIIVCVILLSWGIYSVNSNIKEFKEENYLYFLYYSDLMEDQMKDARNEAIGFWVITSICYLIPSEVISLVLRKTVDEEFLDDLPEDNPQPLNLAQEINMNSGTTDATQNSTSQGDTSQTANNIKWDL